mmetsp:Transcript_34278/g.94489  ORF Transcript_34278/g.94489 Transcript_34278/m.94489 type:complete len:257 (+) Transcript_34278:392-1162(+)
MAPPTPRLPSSPPPRVSFFCLVAFCSGAEARRAKKNLSHASVMVTGPEASPSGAGSTLRARPSVALAPTTLLEARKAALRPSRPGVAPPHLEPMKSSQLFDVPCCVEACSMQSVVRAATIPASNAAAPCAADFMCSAKVASTLSSSAAYSASSRPSPSCRMRVIICSTSRWTSSGRSSSSSCGLAGRRRRGNPRSPARSKPSVPITWTALLRLPLAAVASPLRCLCCRRTARASAGGARLSAVLRAAGFEAATSGA